MSSFLLEIEQGQGRGHFYRGVKVRGRKMAEIQRDLERETGQKLLKNRGLFTLFLVSLFLCLSLGSAVCLVTHSRKANPAG